MKRAILGALGAGALSLALTVSGSAAAASPAHAICDDLGPDFTFGISNFDSVGDWNQVAYTQYGVDWKFMYVYVSAPDDSPSAVSTWLQQEITAATAAHAFPVFTFYQLLKLGQGVGMTGSESSIVQAVLQDATLMKQYFDNFINVVQTAQASGVPVIVQVEPDSWGFMIWTFGVNGNPDATSVPVDVASSGHPDVAGFPDNASGLGQALLHLRDKYAPSVRMGWHASNFRSGTGADIVASFYSTMGPYDVLFSETEQLEANQDQWWLPWDETMVEQNLSWWSTLTTSAHLPILLWQADIGTTDFHLFPSDPTMRTRFASANVAGVMFAMDGSGDPDDFRSQTPGLDTVPPASSGAGGTAADMRTRLAAYSKAPLPWPAGSLCAGSSSSGSSSSSSGSTSSSSGSTSSSSSSSGSTSSGSSSSSSSSSGSGGSGGHHPGSSSSSSGSGGSGGHHPGSGSSSSGSGGHHGGWESASVADSGGSSSGEQSATGCSYQQDGRSADGGQWLWLGTAGLAVVFSRRRRRG